MKRDEKIEKASTPAMEEEKMEVEEEEEGGGGGDALAAAVAALKEEEELWEMRFGVGVGVDEMMMNWGTLCLPSWNVEFVENNYAILFNDVLWNDDDLWNFDTSTHHHHHYHNHHLTSTLSLPSHLPP